MRVWEPIDPSNLDRSRLLGEHREIHAIYSIILYDKKGYRNHPEVKRWVRHLPALKIRHDKVVTEMLKRGYRHVSDLVDAPGCADMPNPWEPTWIMWTRLMNKLMNGE